MMEASAVATASVPPRPRPELHFTPTRGWTNDPHGIVFVDGRYHLFFQHNPAAAVWSEACHWGHATSEDLLVWTEEEVALSPRHGEVGCWSGCLVFDHGVPTILYTRVIGHDWRHGQIALARGSASLDAWRRDPITAVIATPPAELDVAAFRDPFVWRHGNDWRMVVGIGTAEGSAALVQYSSRDLVAWWYDGVLTERHTSERDPIWTGAMWECPQLFQLDGSWVLLASVWSDHVLHYVVYALGDYHGRSFVPRTWGRFSHGDELYATSTFLDAQGHRCVMSWVRERKNMAPLGSAYAGALSLPHVLALEDDRLLVRLHPNLDTHMSESSTTGPITPASGRVHVGVVTMPSAISVDYTSSPDAAITLVFGSAGDERLRIRLDQRGRKLVVETLLEQILSMPVQDDGVGALSLVLDADILEVIVRDTSGVGAVRVPDVHGCGVLVEVEGACTVDALIMSRLKRDPHLDR